MSFGLRAKTLKKDTSTFFSLSHLANIYGTSFGTCLFCYKKEGFAHARTPVDWLVVKACYQPISPPKDGFPFCLFLDTRYIPAEPTMTMAARKASLGPLRAERIAVSIFLILYLREDYNIPKYVESNKSTK